MATALLRKFSLLGLLLLSTTTFIGLHMREANVFRAHKRRLTEKQLFQVPESSLNLGDEEILPSVRQEKEALITGKEMQAPRQKLGFSRKRSQENEAFIRRVHTEFASAGPLISIRGLMSSGTNWLRALVNKNCPGLVWTAPSGIDLDADGLFGWKHDLLSDDELERLKLFPDERIVIITRDPIEWTASVKKMSSQGHFGEQSRIASRKGGVAFQSAPITTNCFGEKWMKSYYENCGFLFLEFENIYSMRSTKYENWLLASQILPDQILIVKYESLASQFNETLSKIIGNLPKSAGCKHLSDLERVEGHVKFGKIQKKAFHASDYHKRACEFFARNSEMSFLRSNADLSLETKLGYDPLNVAPCP